MPLFLKLQVPIKSRSCLGVAASRGFSLREDLDLERSAHLDPSHTACMERHPHHDQYHILGREIRLFRVMTYFGQITYILLLTQLLV